MLSQLSYAPVPVRRRVKNRLSASDLIILSYSKLFVKIFFLIQISSCECSEFLKIVKEMKYSFCRICDIFLEVIFKAVRDTGKILLKALCPDVRSLPAGVHAGRIFVP